MRTSGIYAIYVPGVGVYVGASTNISVRVKAHLWRLRRGIHHAKKLQRAWDSCGGVGVTHEVLEICEEDSLRRLEREWMMAVKDGKLLNSTENQPYTAPTEGLDRDGRRASSQYHKVVLRVQSLFRRAPGVVVSFPLMQLTFMADRMACLDRQFACDLMRSDFAADLIRLVDSFKGKPIRT